MSLRSALKRMSLGLGLSFGLVVVLEAGLRVAKVGPDSFPSPLAFQAVHAAPAITTTTARLWPHGRPRAARIEPAGLRIMLFGESAAEGDGFTPWSSMGGVIERTLRATLPEAVEVLNFSTPGVGSRQIVETERAALASERPAVVVLYIGNNELHELRAIKASSPHYDARSELFRRKLWNLHLYRLLASWLRPQVATQQPARALASMETLADDDDRALAMFLFEENLRLMVGRARDLGVPVVLSTVAVNEYDWYDGGDPAETAAHRAGVALIQKGDLVGGRAIIRAAESKATRPLRALPEARAISRRVAAAYGVTLCDVEQSLTDRSPHGLPGNDLFGDACHPNLEGHEEIGVLLSQCILDATGRSETLVQAPIQPDPRRLDRWTGHREPELPDDGSSTRAFERGHQRFLLHDIPQARQWWEAARARGGDPNVVALNLAWLAIYEGDLERARKGIREELPFFPGDTQLEEALRALGG